jgi:hypothetical protein
VVRSLDATDSPVLSLGLVGTRDGFVCTVGEPRGDVAPLGRARCRSAPLEELAAVPRATLDTEPMLAGSRYQLGGSSAVVVTRGDASITIAPIPEEPEAVRVCETTGIDIVVIEGRLVHDVRQTTVAFVGEGVLVGVGTAETHAADYHFACRPEEARLTWLETDIDVPILLVRQVVCGLAGCESIMSRLPRAGTDPMVASIAGQVLLVYAGDEGTRMRLAPITEIGSAPDLAVPPGDGSAVLSRALFARGGAAIVTIRTASGVEALRVDVTGRVARLPVDHDG